jgi:hypothetical protein
MIILKATTENLNLVTSSAADIDFSVSFVDITTTTFTPSSQEGKISSATTTDVCSAPASSTQRQVKVIFISNVHASTSNTVTIYKTISGTNYELWSGTLLAGEFVSMTSEGEFKVYSSGGVQKNNAQGGPVDVQVFTTPGANTWTKPTTFSPKIVEVVMWGAGGGGGAGASLATAVVAKGGAGGGGGAFNRKIFRASDLADTENLNVGLGGAAGTPGAAGALGGDGGVGGASTFGTTTMLIAWGGGGGRGGAISAAAGGGGGGGGTGSNGSTGSTSVGNGGFPISAAATTVT